MYGKFQWLRLVGVAFGAVQGGLGEATLLGSAALYTDPVICLAMWSSGTGFAGPAGYIIEIFIMKKAVAWVRVVVGQIIVGIFLFSYFGILKAPPQGWPTKISRANESTGTMTTKERFNHVLILWPYMIPLFLVYFAEYVIQAGVWTSYSFDPSQVSIPENRDEAYLWLNFLYQWGVFISRSSTILFVLNRTSLWIMPFIQIGMLLLFSFNATNQFWNGLSLLVPAFITGLLGGGVYVNAFTLISKEVEQAYVEFSLSAASVADTFGIICGDILSMFLQGCLYQQLGFANQADVSCPFA